MSRRAIKRYEQVLEADKLSRHAASEDDVDEEHSLQSSPLAPRAQGLFALLEDEEDGEDDDSSTGGDTAATDSALPSTEGRIDDRQRSEGNDSLEIEQQLDASDNGEPRRDAGPERKKKKKKRRGRRRQGTESNQETDPDWIALNEMDKLAPSKEEDITPGWIPSSYFADNDTDDIRSEARKILASVEAMVQAEPSASFATLQSASLTSLSKVLHVEPRLLNADSELKRLFGSRVIETERRADEATAVATGRRRGRTGARAHLRRKVSIVSPRDTWFAEAPGLVMVLDSDATNDSLEGIRYYRYVHESSYARIQDEYRVLVGTHDPNMLVELSSRYPYHVDTLLQLAEVYRQMGELDRAAEMVERCLYVLETAWNIGFKPYDGNCRIRFDVLENRSLFVALFRYSQLLTRRGLHRTALEIAKLLLNFEPEKDPMGMLMLSDSFALLSGEFKWIQAMQSAFQLIPIRYFPNFAASAAIAHESIRLGVTGISNRGTSGKSKKSSSGKDNPATAGASEQAEELLIDALLTFPMLLRPLLSAIQDESGVWAEHRLFDEGWYSAGYEDYGVMARMCRVYAERSKLIWNSTANKQLLVKCARAAGAMDSAAGTGEDPETGRLTSAYVSDPAEHPRVARCRAQRAEAGEWLRRSGLYRSVQISDFADSTTNLPAEILAGDGGDQAVGAPVPREVSLSESAWEFLQSLLPWREAQDAQQSDT